MYMIEISDSKVDKMSEYVEDMLWAGGELMHCLEKMKGGHGYGHKEHDGTHYGRHHEYYHDGMSERGRMGYRVDDDWDDDDMGERRRRSRRTGRYM